MSRKLDLILINGWVSSEYSSRVHTNHKLED